MASTKSDSVKTMKAMSKSRPLKPASQMEHTKCDSKETNQNLNVLGVEDFTDNTVVSTRNEPPNSSVCHNAMQLHLDKTSHNTYTRALAKLEAMTKEAKQLGKQCNEMSEEFADLESRCRRIEKDMKYVTDEAKIVCEDAKTDKYLSDMIDNLTLYGESIHLAMYDLEEDVRANFTDGDTTCASHHEPLMKTPLGMRRRERRCRSLHANITTDDFNLSY